MTKTQTGYTFTVAPENSLRLETARDLYLNAIAGALAPLTVEWLGGKLNASGVWTGGVLMHLLDHFGPATAVETITLDHLNRWRAILLSKPNPRTGKPYSAQSVDGFLRAAKTFFGWLTKHHYLADNPAALLKRPKLPRRARRGISEENAQAMLDLAAASVRDLALLSVFDATGCRRGGLVDLRLGDVDLEKRRLLVREKGDKERTVFLTPAARDRLKAWLDVRPARPGVDHVFVSEQPGKRLGRPLTKSGISQILKRLKVKGKLTGKVSPHQWRHRRMKLLTSKGVPLGVVADIAGHADVRTTHQFYNTFAVDETQNIYDRFTGDEESP